MVSVPGSNVTWVPVAGSHGSYAWFPFPMVPVPSSPRTWRLSLKFLCVFPCGSCAWFPFVPLPISLWVGCLFLMSQCLFIRGSCSWFPTFPIPIFLWILSLVRSISYKINSLFVPICGSLRFISLIPFGYNACLVPILCPCSSYTWFPYWFLCPVPIVPMSVSLYGLYARFPLILITGFLWFLRLLLNGFHAWFPLVSSGSQWFPMSMSDSLQFLTSSDYCACFPRFPIDWFPKGPRPVSCCSCPWFLRFLYLVPSGSYVRFPIVFISTAVPPGSYARLPMVFISDSLWFLCPIPYGFYIWFPLVPMSDSL